MAQCWAPPAPRLPAVHLIEFDLVQVAVHVRHVARLQSKHVLIQPLDRGMAGKAHHLVALCDRLHRREHHRRAARRNLLELAHLAPSHRPLLHGDAHVPRSLQHDLLGRRRQHRRRVRRDERAVLRDAEEVGGRELLHICVRLCVEVQADREATLLRDLGREHVRSVVARALDEAHAEGGGAVILGDDERVHALQPSATLVVRANRVDGEEESVLGGGTETELGSVAEDERAYVQRAARAARGHELGVHAHGRLYTLKEQFARHLGHQ
mmetsp:Transcript_1889/g.4825  ORF Transcript_1889/g.4825 Transcript_1889/m.4825 type:complete len:268 (-) Transcript_1889:264-1067(-)